MNGKEYVVVDIGNQDTVAGLFDASGALKIRARIPTHRRSTSELEIWLEHLWKKSGLQNRATTNVAIASVVPQVDYLWTEASLEVFGKAPWFLSHTGIQDGLKISVDYPDEVGADRLANAIAVTPVSTGAAVVMDFGTATTFDVIVAEHHYVGGLIAPGLGLAVESLGRSTALLPRISLSKIRNVIGQNTVDAMTSGAYWGYVSMVEGLIRRVDAEIRTRYKEKLVTYYATGGQCELICEGLEGVSIQVDQDLTLRGVYRAAQRSLENLALKAT